MFLVGLWKGYRDNVSRHLEGGLAAGQVQAACQSLEQARTCLKGKGGGKGGKRGGEGRGGEERGGERREGRRRERRGRTERGEEGRGEEGRRKERKGEEGGEGREKRGEEVWDTEEGVTLFPCLQS